MTREDEIEARFEAMRSRQLEPRKQHFDDIAFLLRRSRQTGRKPQQMLVVFLFAWLGAFLGAGVGVVLAS